jgi:anti-sigma factor RsiW
MNPMKMTEDDLHAYVDGALPREREAEVETWLAGHPEDAERVAAYRAQKLALKALFDPVLDEPVPEKLHALQKTAKIQNSGTAATGCRRAGRHARRRRRLAGA